MSTNFTAAVERGCGYRVVGDAYITFGLANEEPLENYLVCPPKPLDLKRLGLSPIGVNIIVRNGVTHIVDFVGQNNYPHAADILEEVRLYGVSRKIPRSALQTIAKNHPPLNRQSKLLLIHAEGYIHNYAEYYKARDEGMAWCGRGLEAHNDPQEMCSSLHWESLDRGVMYDTESPRDVLRNLPSLSYIGQRSPDGVTPVYSPAFIGSFPLHEIQIPIDTLSNRHVFSEELARQASNIKVRLTEE